MKVALLKTSTPGIPAIYRWIDALSHWRGHGGYGHAELLFADGMALSAHTDVGVAVRPLTAVYPLGDWDLFDVGHEGDEDLVRDWADGEIGSHYDFAGVLRFVLPFIRPSRKAWFCSEIVTAALQQARMFKLIDAWRVSPNALAQMLLATGHEAEGSPA